VDDSINTSNLILHLLLPEPLLSYLPLTTHLLHTDTFNTSNPLTEEIRLKIFGTPDWPVFPALLLSDGDSRSFPYKTV